TNRPATATRVARRSTTTRGAASAASIGRAASTAAACPMTTTCKGVRRPAPAPGTTTGDRSTTTRSISRPATGIRAAIRSTIGTIEVARRPQRRDTPSPWQHRGEGVRLLGSFVSNASFPMPGKRIAFDEETWQAVDLLARDRMMDFQELADEAFRDILKKYG